VGLVPGPSHGRRPRLLLRNPQRRRQIPSHLRPSPSSSCWSSLRSSRPCGDAVAGGWRRAKQKGRQTACHSNNAPDWARRGCYRVRSSGTSCRTANAYTWPGQRELYGWQDFCRPYINSEPVYSCPSAFPARPMDGFASASTPRPLVKDYICNAHGGAYPESGSGLGQRERPFINNWRTQPVHGGDRGHGRHHRDL